MTERSPSAVHLLRFAAIVGLIIAVGPLGLAAAERTGVVKGLIVDAATQQPLPGANAVLLDAKLGAMAGDDGRFAIAGVPLGTYRLQVSMIGYESRIQPDVVVRANRITTTDVQLTQQSIGMGKVVVTADYFSEVEEEAVSAVHLNYEEIRRSPGAAGDISRLLQAMPSVNMSTDQRNDLIVRGGSPAENLTIIDNIEVPNINHFPTQGASGGPIGLLNTDLIADVSFHAGGFGAAYGDRLSSVMVIDMREGNRDEFDGEANMSMAGAGFIFEHPISDGRGSWVASARRSYLDLIVGAIGTGAVPRYSDVQGKVVYDLTSNHQLSLLGLSGFDAIDVEPNDQDEEDDFISLTTDQYVAGTNWRWLWSTSGYANTSLAFTYADFVVDVTDGDTKAPIITNDSQERELVLRSNFQYAPSRGTELSWGLVARRVFSDYGIFAVADTNRVGQTTPRLDVRQDISSAKVGLYASWEQQILPSRLTSTVGLRFEYFDLNEESDLAPRLALSYQLGEGTSLNAAYGIYYQNLPPLFLVQDPANQQLENPRADHYVVGLRHLLTPNTLFSLEGYLKEYSQLPFDPDDPTFPVIDSSAGFGSPVPGRLVGGGKATSQGFEALVQKKLAQSLYGTLSYGYSVSKYTDLLGKERNRTFDNRHLASVILGYRASDRLEYSVRWRYAGGRPDTPFDKDRSETMRTGIIDPLRVNEDRLPAYHRLDLRVDYRKQYESFNLVSFFSLLNAYNRANVWDKYWDEDDNAEGTIEQWAFIPIGGFELEF